MFFNSKNKYFLLLESNKIFESTPRELSWSGDDKQTTF